jgi:parallel beta-helix repeat protein
VISHNKEGIRLVNVSKNEIVGNRFNNNKDGILGCCGADNNTIFLNSFIDNDRHARAPENNYDNGSCGNYWDDYTGVDADGDGIGDTPHDICNKAQDRFPLMKPYNLVNHPPSLPVITGPTYGETGVKYDYFIESLDPDGDNVSYLILWGDNTGSLSEPFPSGIEVTVGHTWEKKGIYTIMAIAIDTYNATSDWTSLGVTMPKSRLLDVWFSGLFERYPWLYSRKI